jgi:surface polysaccharide O-acyltransferase-like enzyme
MDKLLSQKFRVVSLVLMIMVVYLHSYNIDTKQGGQILELPKDLNWFIQSYISYGITRIAVPLFFIISGYFFVFDNKNSVADISMKIRKRMKTLVIPYVFWAVFGILIYLILQSVPQSQQFFTKQLIKDYTFLQWLDAILVNPIPYQLWFLKDLIVLVVLSPILLYLLKKLKLFFLAIILPFWLTNSDTVFLTSEALLFFTSGLYIGFYRANLISLVSNTKISLLIVWFLIVALKVYAGFADHEIVALILLKTSILIGVPAFWLSYELWASDGFRKTMSKFAQYSFFIYVFHEPMLTMIKKGMFSPLAKVPSTYLIIYFVAPIMAIGISVITAIIFNKIFPKLYNIVTGSR